MSALQYPAWLHWPAVWPLVAVLVALLLGWLLQRGIFALACRWTHDGSLPRELLQCLRRPVALALPLLAAAVALGLTGQGLWPRLQRALMVALVLAVTWALIRLVKVGEDWIRRRNPVTVDDNYAARRILTQTELLAKVVAFAIGLFGLAAALMLIPAVRQVGASLLASAGLAGIVLGFAARPVLGNLIAGVQLAFAQPLRLDDVLIVEGQWGRVEEITGTYVVMRLWDDRRQIVPLQWFIDHPFENWTRRSARLTGEVKLWVDYRIPVAAVRAELRRICEQAPEWDQRVCVLQVSDASDRAIELRALVSASNAGQSSDLRNRVREALVGYIVQNFPDALPRVRSDPAEPPADAGKAAWAVAPGLDQERS